MQTRAAVIAQLDRRGASYDIAVIGGGANGAGIALDAASRGLSVALFERGDFGSGTSSRSSKLIHGGVRYVGLGQWGLVREALAERAALLNNAPGLVTTQRFMLPAYSHLQRAKFRLGLKLYDWLAGSRGLEASVGLAAADAAALSPALRRDGLRGAVTYDDAMFDDVRLLISILERAGEYGAALLNHAEVSAITRDRNGRASGVVVQDRLGDRELELSARVVINATGAYADAVRKLDDPAAAVTLSPSQGTHIVVAGRFGAAPNALVLPHRRDGRILFVLPWYGHTLIGTTDTLMPEAPREPRALDAEVEDILAVAARFLDPAPRRADIESVFAGLRPLVGVPDGAPTARRSREHAFDVSRSGLVTVSGGKWTTYRLIAAQAVDLAVRHGDLRAPPSSTAGLALVRPDADAEQRYADWGAAGAGLSALVRAQPELGMALHPELPYCGAHFVWAARNEQVLTVADALAYRSRALFINAAAALAIAPTVARLMARELKRDEAWINSEIANTRLRAQYFSLAPL